MLLISGHKGFIGKNLKEYLGSSYNILGVTRSPVFLDEISYEKLGVSHFNKADAFIHLAGKAHDLKKVQDEAEYFLINTELTKRLFSLYLLSDCPVFIYLSSVKASADRVDKILKESDIAKPTTVYGRSKRAAEEYLLSANLPSTKRLYILRPVMIHGNGNKGNLNLLYRMISKGIPYPLGAFANKRSLVSVENVCFIIKELSFRKDIESGIYNVADDRPLSTNEIINIIGGVIGKKATILSLPVRLIDIIAKLGDCLNLPINSENLQKLTDNYVVSNEKIKSVLKMNLPIDSEQGLIGTIEFFKKSKED